MYIGAEMKVLFECLTSVRHFIRANIVANVKTLKASQ